MSNCLSLLAFSQDIRVLLEPRTGTEPAGEIRGGIHEYISHSDVGPKVNYKSRNCKKNGATDF